MPAIEITGFWKRYGALEAVRGVSLTIEKGELFGLIGPDGAGKTTLMRTVCTLLAPSDGSILVQGMDVTSDVVKVRAILGYMPQRFSLYQDLSVEQNLRFFADLFQVPEEERAGRLEELYRFSRLEPFKRRKAGALSGGMKQKLSLSCALIHRPEVLILDEPTFGVDPVSRQEFWEILRSIQKSGAAVLVSTAYMDEAAQCDRVALMHNGKFVAVGTPGELRSGFIHPLYRVRGRDLRSLRSFFGRIGQVHATQLFGDAIHVSFAKHPSRSDWEQWMRSSGGNLQHWDRQDPSIEDVFMELVEGAS